MAVSLARYKFTFWKNTSINIFNRYSKPEFIDQYHARLDMTQATTNDTGDFEHFEVQENVTGLTNVLIKWEKDDLNPNKSLELWDVDYAKVEIEGGAKPVYYFVTNITRINPGMVSVALSPDWLTTVSVDNLQVSGFMCRHHVGNDTPFTYWAGESFAPINALITDLDFINTSYNINPTTFDITSENSTLRHLLISQNDMLDANKLFIARTYVDEDGFNAVATPIISPIVNGSTITLKLDGAPAPNSYTYEMPLAAIYDHKVGMANTTYAGWVETLKQTGNDFLITSSYVIPENFFDASSNGTPMYANLMNSYRWVKGNRAKTCGQFTQFLTPPNNYEQLVRNNKSWYYYVSYKITNLGSGDTQMFSIMDIWASASDTLIPDKSNFLQSFVRWSLYALLTPTGSVYMRPWQFSTIVGQTDASQQTALMQRNNYTIGIVRGLPWITQALGIMGSAQTAQAISANAFNQARIGNQLAQLEYQTNYGLASNANYQDKLNADLEANMTGQQNDLQNTQNNLWVSLQGAGQQRDNSNFEIMMQQKLQAMEAEASTLKAQLARIDAESASVGKFAQQLGMRINTVASAQEANSIQLRNALSGGMMGVAGGIAAAGGGAGSKSWTGRVATAEMNLVNIASGAEITQGGLTRQISNNNQSFNLTAQSIQFQGQFAQQTYTKNVDLLNNNYDYQQNQLHLDNDRLREMGRLGAAALGIASAESNMNKNIALYLNPYNVQFAPDVGFAQMIQFVFLISCVHYSPIDILRLDRHFTLYGYSTNKWVDYLSLTKDSTTGDATDTNPTIYMDVIERVNTRLLFNWIEFRECYVTNLSYTSNTFGFGVNNNLVKVELQNILMSGVRLWHSPIGWSTLMRNSNTILYPNTDYN